MRLAALALLLLGCAHAPRVIPESIALHGGLYMPWTPMHTAHRDTVLACLGLTQGRPNPTLWIARANLVVRGRQAWAYYDGASNAVVFAGTMPVEHYWPVFRHEMLHATEGTPGHGTNFTRAAECGFWPHQ